MLKIVVFDGGWGGNLVADFLEKELGMVEVTRVIDWDHAPYDEHALPEIHCLVEKSLQEYIGRVDVIVLGGYTVSLAINFLQNKYQEQKFVGMGVNYHRILKARLYPEYVTVMMNERMGESELCADLRENLPFSTIILPDCSGWEGLSNYGELSRTKLYDDLSDYFVLHAGRTPINLSDKSAEAENRPLIELIREAKQREKAEKAANRTLASQEKTEVIPQAENDNGDAAPEPPAVNYKKIESDVVLLLNTNFWDVKEDLEELFGYKVRIMDFREKLLHDTCVALGLRGTHGGRSK